MKPYGQKHASKICSCVMCGKAKKDAVKKRERQKAKKEIDGLQHTTIRRTEKTS